MIQLNLPEIFKYSEDFKIDEQKPSEFSFIQSYPALVKFFEHKSSLEKEDIIVGAHMVYGWMPRMLIYRKLDKFSYDELCKQLNEIRRTGLIKENQFYMISRIINNSYVGASKLLHFMRPDKFPIWDSHVCRYLDVKVDDIKKYFEYVEVMQNSIMHPEFLNVYKNIKEKLSYDDFEVTKIRVLEMLIFSMGRKIKRF